MFEDESPGGLEEDQRALREDNKEAHEVMAAQREEMRQREKKERMEMLEALMGGYQVEDLLESAGGSGKQGDQERGEPARFLQAQQEGKKRRREGKCRDDRLFAGRNQ